MAGKAYSIGLAEVQFGKASKVGFMPLTMQKIGIVYKGTCKVTQDAPDVTEHYEEGENTPFISISTKKPAKIAFSVVVDSLETLKLLLGGSVDGQKWADNSTVAGNLALRIISKQGLMLELPNASITGTIDWEMTSEGLFKINVEASPQSVDTGKQLAMTPIKDTLDLDIKIMEFSKDANSTGITATATGVASITTAVVLGSAPWVSVSNTGATVKVTVQANTGEARSATVAVVADGKSANIVVAQNGAV